MLQGFYWDSYTDTQWSYLESQADELAQYFSLIWVPQSGNCNSSYNVMGYTPVYYFDHNSSFGSETQLRSMISTFKSKGLGTVADVVINHRNNLGVNGSWVDFPAETYNGTTYQMYPTDICGDDDNGTTLTWATANGYTLGAYDTGEGWSGCRDLDHTSQNVQTCINAYLKYLLDDLGYTGFRYDMTKGYSASYTAMYNKASGVEYSVGEYWDGNTSVLKTWVDGTADNGTIMSAAFDFPFRYTVRDAINNSTWSSLGNTSLTKTSGYSRYAVTFVENHDTEYRSASEQQDPIRKDTLAANAYLLAMPGTPCVFLPHWKACKEEIKAMIDARRTAGITNTSSSSTMRSAVAYFASKVTGSNGELIVVVGSNADGYDPTTDGYTKILGGYHYRYYLSNSTNTAWIDKPSGDYTDAFDVNVTAVTASDAELVYTLDGSTPTADSPKVSDGKVTVSSSCTLTVGLLAVGEVSGIVSRTYTITPFTPHTATVYFKDPGWSTVYFYAWDSDGELNGTWPGTRITSTTEKGGETWYYQTFSIDAADYTFNIIFTKGSSGPQTVDISAVSQDVYYELGELSGKYYVNDVTSEYATGISVTAAGSASDSEPVKVYTADGRLLRTLPAGTTVGQAVDGLRKGVYILGGKKMVVR